MFDTFDVIAHIDEGVQEVAGMKIWVIEDMFPEWKKIRKLFAAAVELGGLKLILITHAARDNIDQLDMLLHTLVKELKNWLVGELGN